MLDLSLFRRPAFAGASIVAFTLSASIFAMFLYLTLYIQDVLGYSPLQAGLRFLPVTLLSFVVAPIAGRLSVRVPVRLLLGSGLLLVGAGLLTMTAVDASSGWTVLIPGFVLAGAGVGMVNPPLASTAIGVVHVRAQRDGLGHQHTFRQVGIATGIAGLGAVFQHERDPQDHRGPRIDAGGPPRPGSAHGPALGRRSSRAKCRRSPAHLPRAAGRRSSTPTASASPTRSRRILVIAAIIARDRGRARFRARARPRLRHLAAERGRRGSRSASPARPPARLSGAR